MSIDKEADNKIKERPKKWEEKSDWDREIRWGHEEDYREVEELVEARVANEVKQKRDALYLMTKISDHSLITLVLVHIFQTHISSVRNRKLVVVLITTIWTFSPPSSISAIWSTHSRSSAPSKCEILSCTECLLGPRPQLYPYLGLYRFSFALGLCCPWSLVGPWFDSPLTCHWTAMPACWVEPWNIGLCLRCCTDGLNVCEPKGVGAWDRPLVSQLLCLIVCSYGSRISGGYLRPRIFVAV